MDLKLDLHDREKSKEAEEILKNLIEYNAQFTPSNEFKSLTISYKDDSGKVVAGLTGSTNWGWLFVRLLWVSENLRGQGYGKKLMSEAESEAKKRGCHGVWLDTFSFQAREFYQSLGYKSFGAIDEFPKGHSRFFLKKEI